MSLRQSIPKVKIAMFLYLLLMSFGSVARADSSHAIQCPGRTTIEMRWCASQKWQESIDLLRKELVPGKLRQWKQTSREVCSSAYDLVKEGTIYLQMITGCMDNLNRSLLKEFDTFRK